MTETTTVVWRRPLFGKNWWWRFIPRRLRRKRVFTQRTLNETLDDLDYQNNVHDRMRFGAEVRVAEVFYRENTGGKL